MKALAVYVSRVSPVEAPAKDMGFLQLAEAFVSALANEGGLTVLDGSGEAEDEPRASMEMADFFVPLLTSTYVQYVSGKSTTGGGADEMLDFTLGRMLRGTTRTVPVILDPALLNRGKWPRCLRDALGVGPVVDLTANEKLHTAVAQLADILQQAQEEGVLSTRAPGARVASKAAIAATLRTVRRVSNESLSGTRAWLHTVLTDKLRETKGKQAARVALQGPSGAGKSVFLAQFCLRGQLHNPASTFRELASPPSGRLDGLFAGSHEDRDLNLESRTTTASDAAVTGPDALDMTGPEATLDLADDDLDATTTGKRKSLIKRLSMRASRRSNATMVSTGTFTLEMPPLVAGAYFFRREDAAGCTMEAMVRTLAAQLCETIPGFYEALCAVQQQQQQQGQGKKPQDQQDGAGPRSASGSRNGRKRLFKDLVAAPLRRLAIKPNGKAYIVLDGIEELDAHDARSLLSLLHTKWDKFMPPWLGAVVAVSSSTPPLPAPFTTLELDIGQQKHQGDIELYLRTYLSRLPRKGATVAQERAQGLFLRARFLTAEKSVRGLKQVPTDQHEYLTKLLRKFLGDGEDLQLRRDMLAALCVAREPLPLRLAADAVPYLTVADLDPLFDLVDDKVRFVHASIARYLAAPTAEEDLAIDERAGHAALARVYRENYLIDDCAARQAMYHLCRANQRSIATRVLGDLDLLRYTFGPLAVPPRGFARDCKEWFFHAPPPDVFAPPARPPAAAAEAAEAAEGAQAGAAAETRAGRAGSSSSSSSSGAASLVETGKKEADHDMTISSPAMRECGPVVNALAECAEILENDPDELVGQLVGRLPLQHPMRASVDEFAPDVWLQPLAPSLGAPGTKRARLKAMEMADIHAAAVWGDLVAIQCTYSPLRVYSRSTRKTLRVMHGHDGVCKALALDDEHLVSGSTDRTIKVWSLASGACLYTLRGHADELTQLRLAEAYIVSASRDGCVMLWSRESQKCIRQIKASASAVLALDMDDEWIVTGRADGAVHLYAREHAEQANDAPGKLLAAHDAEVRAVRLHGPLALTASGNEVHVWDLAGVTAATVDEEEGEHGRLGPMRKYEKHRHPVVAIEITADGFVASADEASFVRVWAPTDGATVHSFGLGRTAKMRLAVEGNTLLVPGRKDDLFQIHRPWGRHEHWVSHMTCERESGLIVSAAQGNLKLWDVESGLPLRSLSCGEIWDVAMDRKSIVAALASGALEVFSRDTFEKESLAGHRGLVRCVDMDEEIILSGSKDRTARVWLRETHECVAVLTGHDSMVVDVKIMGDELVTVSNNGTRRVWNRETSELLRDSLEEGEDGGVEATSEAAVQERLAEASNGADQFWHVAADGKRIVHRETGACITLPSPVQRLYHAPSLKGPDNVAVFDEAGAFHLLRLRQNASQMI